MIRFVRTVNRHTDVGSLLRSQDGHLHTNFFKEYAGYLFILIFSQTIYIDIVFLVEQLDLGQCLIGE